MSGGGLLFRAPTPDERRRVRAAWVDAFGPRTSPIVGDATGDRYIRVGRFPTTGLSPRLWYRMHGALVEALLEGAELATFEVTALASVPDVALGAVCWSIEHAPDQATVHSLHVERAARRSGIGRRMLDRVASMAGEIPIRYSHMTRDGLALVDAWISRRAQQASEPA